jgi:zinc transport system substrate-binding protein
MVIHMLSSKSNEFPAKRVMETGSVVRGLFVVVCVIAVMAAFGSCRPAGRSGVEGRHKVRVVTTLFPLYDMARSIGAEKAEVSLLLPPGVEPHSFEPTPGDIVKINKADVFIYTGKFMEPWAEGIIKGAAEKNLIVVDASLGTKMISGASHDKDGPAGSPDPHIWLDFDNAKIMLENILRAFSTKDDADRAFYERNAADYSSTLAGLDSLYRTTLASCRKKEIIYAGHYAFGYLAARYGIKYLAAQGVSPDAEPTVKDLGRLVEQIKKDKVKYIYYEELTSPKIAETIAGETNARMLLLTAAHNLPRDKFERGISFFDVLRNDLDNLKIGLECR